MFIKQWGPIVPGKQSAAVTKPPRYLVRLNNLSPLPFSRTAGEALLLASTYAKAFWPHYHMGLYETTVPAPCLLRNTLLIPPHFCLLILPCLVTLPDTIALCEIF